MSITFRSVFLLLTLSLASCQSVYYSAWEKLGVEKRDILVDRVEDARDSQTEAQAEFASALAEFSALINFDGGELESVYHTLSSQFDDAQTAADDVELKRIDTATDFYFELNMQDVWVWDIYRSDRFVKQVKVMTFKDVNVEEIGSQELEIPEELAVGDQP